MDNLIIDPTKGPLSAWVVHHGYGSLEDFFHYLAKIPYQRISHPHNLRLVLEENRATCSSKHALAKAIAEEQEWNGIQLQLVLFKMGTHNTPRLQSAFQGTPLSYVPEAHCRLLVNQQVLDLTFGYNTFSIHPKDILQTDTVSSEFVLHHKVNWHQTHLKNWQEQQYPSISPHEIWSIRELCINLLSQK